MVTHARLNGPGCRGRRSALLTALVFALGGVRAQGDHERLLDLQRSTVTIRVGTEGLLSRFAPDIRIEAPLGEGAVDESIPHMQVVFEAAQLRVLGDGLTAADRAAIQSRMTGPEVLDVAEHPWVHYHSVTVERTATGWLIHGELDLHGTILPLQAVMRREGERYVGSATVRLHEFGIAPVRRWGGLIRVRDDLTVEFNVLLAQTARSR
jgi:hypothetical protein